MLGFFKSMGNGYYQSLKLISIALDPKVRGYTAVQAISESFKIIQSGVVDRENKIEMKKLREAMERLSGDRIQDDFIDV